MQVVFDASFIALLLYPGARAPLDKTTKRPVDRCQDRIEFLTQVLGKQGTRIIIPTPALAEFLVLAGSDGPKYLDDLSGSSAFRVQAFDERAAVETARLEIDARAKGNKRSGANAAWQKVKIDRQIVAIARTVAASCLYTDDKDIITLCELLHMQVTGAGALPLPPPKDQDLPFPAPGGEDSSE